MKRYDKNVIIRSIKATKAPAYATTADDVDELLLAKAEKEVRAIKQRIATRKHRSKNVK